MKENESSWWFVVSVRDSSLETINMSALVILPVVYPVGWVVLRELLQISLAMEVTAWGPEEFGFSFQESRET